MTRSFPGRRVRLAAAGLTLVLLPVGQAVADTGEAATAPPDRAATKQPSTVHTVTLITGDKVTVTDIGGGKKTVAVDRPKSPEGVVRTYTQGGRITVIPDEVRPYLNAGTLDERLFDVTELIAQGLTDKASSELPLIVTYDDSRSRRSAAVAPRGAERVRSLSSINGAALAAERDTTATFWRTVAPAAPSRPAAKPGARAAASAKATFSGGIEKIWLDGRVKATMAESNEQIGSPKAWEAGLTGKGVKVAVLDTGADLDHPDLKSRVSVSKSFIEGQEVADRNGHGTHVASTVGGSGAVSEGSEKGVAHGADLAVGKVLSDEGSGYNSQIIAGMEWAARDVEAKIINMSLGSSEASDGTDPMAQAVNSLTEETGALFVIAAGNVGAPSSIGSPGAADAALTIGAVDSGDQAAPFTSTGPRIGDNALKPDLSGPGVGILAARSQLTSGDGYYTELSGTSMATPHVAGVAALLAEKHPDWTAQQLKDALMSTSKRLEASPYVLGAGRVSVPDAVDAKVTATGRVDLGFVRWPYETNKPAERTLTYTNSSDEPVTLTLANEVKGPDGKDAPEGVVKLADTTLTVPANGTAQTTVTGDGTDAAVGQTTGRITATVGDTVVAHTAAGMVKEGERHNLTVHLKDRDGKPTAGYLDLVKLAEGEEGRFPLVGESGTLNLRLTPGTYSVMSFLDVRGNRGKDSLGLGFLGDPEFLLDRDRELTLDARTLREIEFDVPKRTETRQAVVEYMRSSNGGGIGGLIRVPLTYDTLLAGPTKKVSSGDFEFRTNKRLGKPMLTVEADGKPLGEATAQGGSTVLDGRHTLDVVDVGTGAAADYESKDVAGKAVVVRQSAELSPRQLVDAAEAAGAKAMFVWDAAPGRLMAYFGDENDESTPLAVATVNQADAALLLKAARDGRKLELDGTRYTPYVYDLSDGHRGSIPKDASYRPGKNDLAVIESKFHDPKSAPGGEFRFPIPDAFPIGVGFLEGIAFPAERTEYVTVDESVSWHESVTKGPLTFEQRSGRVDYPAGKRTELNWFKPVLHPWLGTGLGWGQERAGNDLRFNVPGWGDSGPDHTGFGDIYHDDTIMQNTEVYADGKLVDRRESSGGYSWDSDPEERTYKVVTDATADPKRWALSTKIHAEWTLKSAEAPTDRWYTLPVLNLGFDVNTDLNGNVHSGKKLDLGLFSEYVKGVAKSDTGKIGSGKLEVSFDDGKTWTDVELDAARGKPAAWESSVRVPKNAQYISLRASASDDQGGSVKQEIIRAVGVK